MDWRAVKSSFSKALVPFSWVPQHDRAPGHPRFALKAITLPSPDANVEKAFEYSQVQSSLQIHPRKRVVFPPTFNQLEIPHLASADEHL